jgi:hypothetical protein
MLKNIFSTPNMTGEFYIFYFFNKFNFYKFFTRVWDVLSDENCILDFDKDELDEIKHCLNLSD